MEVKRKVKAATRRMLGVLVVIAAVALAPLPQAEGGTIFSDDFESYALGAQPWYTEDGGVNKDYRRRQKYLQEYW